MFASDYVNTETILHFFNIITFFLTKKSNCSAGSAGFAGFAGSGGLHGLLIYNLITLIEVLLNDFKVKS